jgi:redox-sensitive bicupin YhaK (pirin superfamily)
MTASRSTGWTTIKEGVMPSTRSIAAILTSQATTEGAGVRLKRVFGHREAPKLDPFLLLDDFRSDNPGHYLKGFPWHPHRGIETITYILKGEVAHGDSLGNSGLIGSGDLQWMTAGSGIIHQEMPRGDAQGALQGFQLWTNLPAAQKMMAPRYRGITADQIPSLVLDKGIEVKPIAGTVAGARGPVEDIVTDPTYIDCTVPEAETFTYPTDPAHTVFVYVIGGSGRSAGETIDNGQLALYAEGTQVSVSAINGPVRFLLLAGRPLNESVAWQGPIVMNSEAELETAFREYREGTFIKHKE